MVFDHAFKRTVAGLLGGCTVEENASVGSLPLQIDLLATCKTLPPSGTRIPVLSSRFSLFNVMEYKSRRDTPAKGDLWKLAAYVGLHCQQKGMGLEDVGNVAAFYITARRPSFLDVLLKNDIFSPSGTPGILDMVGQFPCRCHVLVIDELEENEDNLPLMLVAGGASLRRSMRFIARAPRRVRDGLQNYISAMFLLYHDDVKDMTEITDMISSDPDDNIKRGLEFFGIDKVIEVAGIDKVIEVAGIDKVIESIGVEKLESAITAWKAARVK